MRIGRPRAEASSNEHIAASRWSQVAQSVTADYERIDALPLDEAADRAWLMTPGGMSRAEIARRLAARRGVDLAAR